MAGDTLWGVTPTQTELQKLIMNAQYDRGDMRAIRRLLRKRMADKASADYTGMNSAAALLNKVNRKIGFGGDSNLAAEIARVTNQPNPGGSLFDMLSSDAQDVGNQSPIQSIWDAIRF